MLYDLWTTCITPEFFSYFWSAWLNHLLLPLMSEVHLASGACLQLCMHLGLRHREHCSSSQSDLALCAVVMWANSTMRSPQIHHSLLLNGLLQASNKRRDRRFDSLSKTSCGILKTQFVRTRKHEWSLSYIEKNKSLEGGINSGVIYSRLQCCQSRAGKDLFVTDNEGNSMHHENKLSFALSDNDSKQRFWNNYSHFFIKTSHRFLPCVHHAFMLFFSCEEKCTNRCCFIMKDSPSTAGFALRFLPTR